MKRLATIRRQALAYLCAEQTAAGGIVAKASSDPQDFQSYVTHETIFFSALILECLQPVPKSKTLQAELANFLLQHASSSWTWNYWIRGSQAEHKQPYPDDLDDTACALSALHHAQPDLMTGSVLAEVAKVLIQNETTAGGPYETWLIDRARFPVWHDIDVAVNANIGYFLHTQGVQIPGLTDYITVQLQQPALHSNYYQGKLPVLYFIARWYQGPAYAELQAEITEHLLHIETLNSLELALLISGACRLNCDHKLIHKAVQKLLYDEHDGHWPAYALYSEPAKDSVLYYAGSEALTTAFALEALHLYEAYAQPKQVVTPSASQQLETALLQVSNGLPISALRTNYTQFVEKLISHDSDQQVTGMASLTALACRTDVDSCALQALNIASLHGWVAYTIYDNIWDGEPEPGLLGVANVALRQTVLQFANALPDAVDFQTYVHHVLDIVDAANTWEYITARADVSCQTITFVRLPNYGNYHQLAERSLGHVLAATGTLYLAGFGLLSHEQQALRRFFRHFLIARQLNDDAHDWEDDLARGQLTAVVCLLLADAGLADAGTIDLVVTLESLRQTFWDQTIETTCGLIKHHGRLARRALQACPFANRDRYESWLRTLESAAEIALYERNEARDFMTAYSS